MFRRDACDAVFSGRKVLHCSDKMINFVNNKTTIRKMKKMNIGNLAVVAMVALLAGCGGKATSPLSQQAKQRAVKAAKNVEAIESTDTFAIQEALVEAAALRSQYILKDDNIAAEDFDEAFMTHLQTHRPDLAKVLKGSK